ncbi:MAG TPA: hypothetical protein VH062_19225 [Polyangiaceae bacterium]|jgi:hypothetical protein|nr:hypothetical protein [Polyangiaceae bacterium]
MGIFSKIFGNSDDPLSPNAEGGQTDDGKTSDRDTSPPLRAPSRPEQFAKSGGSSPDAASDVSVAPARPRAKTPPAKTPGGDRPSPPDLPARMADVVRAQGSAVQSPRPSVPPRVETLLTSRGDVPAKPAKQPDGGGGKPEKPEKLEGKKRGGAASPAASSKAVAAAPIRPVGMRAVGPATPAQAAQQNATAAGSPTPVFELGRVVEPARSAVPDPVTVTAPGLAPRAEEAKHGEEPKRADGKKPAQAEPLELDPLGNSVVPPRDPSLHHDDVDSAFARIVSHAPQAAAGQLALDEQAKAANAELFRAMVATHAQPIKDFLLELVVGATSKQWLDIARPAVDSIRRGAAELANPELVDALSGFDDAMNAAAKAVGSKIDGAERDALMRAHATLTAALPQAFDLAKDRDLREPLVVRHLLLQVPGVHKVAIDKLYAAGLASLDALCRSSVDDLVQLGRLERDGADAIASRFRQYWTERAAQPVHKAEDRARKKLATLLEQLGSAHQAFQRAEADEDREKKREARNARRASSLAINVLLAQLGEVDLVEELERSPTDRRIERVRSYVDLMARARLPQQKEAS